MSTKYRLVYLWVEKYKNIKDVEINFTLDYQFKKNKKDKVISLDKSHFGELSEKGSNPLADLDIFTAFIGENGAGKSNLIELISFIYTTGRFPEGILDSGEDSFCIIEEKKKVVVFSILYHLMAISMPNIMSILKISLFQVNYLISMSLGKRFYIIL
ncbi:AAA family ATPase [Psychromonas sp. MME1]|uniref:AAA family ATPase n=1 Tax=Psychromonas sp. MME1 TaxID=3231032 RepID=UPI0034E27834